MSLLLQHVGFALPLPNEKLALFSGAQRDPLTFAIDANRVNFVLSDLEGMNRLEVVQVVHTEDTV